MKHRYEELIRLIRTWLDYHPEAQEPSVERCGMCPICKSSMENIGLHTWQCSNCIQNDSNWMNKKLYPSKEDSKDNDLVYMTRKEYLYLKAQAKEKDNSIGEYGCTQFPFGPIPHWISVKDKLPEPEVNVLVCAYGDIYIGFIQDQQWRNSNWSALHVTHWMPLPPPPNE